MRSQSFFRVIKFAFQDLVRNAGLSIMTLLILVMMLLSVNTLIILRVLTDEAVQSVKDHIDVSLFFSPLASEKQITEVKQYVQSFSEVTAVTFINRDDVLAQFRSEYADRPDIIASLSELKDNPLGPTLIVKTREPNDYQKIIKAMSVPEYEKIIEAKTFKDTEKAINRIYLITNQVEKFSLILIALFALIACFIIFNTIHISIYTERAEISIKKLVGATNWFIRGPYFIEALFFTIVSVGLSLVLVLAMLRWLDPALAVIFQREAILKNFFSAHLWPLIGGQMAAVFVLTILSAALAMRRHLRV